MFYIIFNSHIINASTYEYIIRKQINENTNTAFQLQLILSYSWISINCKKKSSEKLKINWPFATTLGYNMKNTG